MLRSLVLFISFLALSQSTRHETTTYLESVADSTVVPSKISTALRLAKQKALARSKAADKSKEAKEMADRVAAEAVKTAQSHLAEQRKKEEAASEMRKKNVQACLEKELAAKETHAKTEQWDAAVDIKSKLEAELTDATERFVKREADIDKEMAKLANEKAELQNAKAALEAKVLGAREAAEQLRRQAVAAGDIKVDKLKAMEQTDKALKDAERDLAEQTQAAQEASAAAENAREGAASAKIQLDKATLEAQRRKQTLTKLMELKKTINRFYYNVDMLTDAMDMLDTEDDNAVKPYDIITTIPEVRPVLVSFNEVALAYANFQNDDAEVFEAIKASIPEIKRNAKEAIHTACDPSNELQHKMQELNRKCGSGMYKKLKLDLVKMPKWS
eukprot:TRINITY_DN5227_c0_g1_i1.p1 TRINITY_DN5227_c0_g1~~TRINITY_DN5227_c0_g1_i1.p1  ORF type:complete len:388 (+),score=105.89 TRINITY_DN5227_c0_g1_i1:88-1251(+)